MITKNTVLILGAGASMPYGFPSGRQLVEDVRDTDIAPAYLEVAGFSPQQLKAFRDELMEADPSSIDGFLEHRKDLISMGKTAIAYALIKYEHPDRLYPTEAAFRRNDRLDKNEQWYRYLAEKLVTGIDSFHRNRLTIVTFNYDRSLDHYLFQSFLRRWGAAAEEVIEAFKSLPIIHLHGQLGPLKWQCEEGQANRPFEGSVSLEAVQIAAAGIRIISDEALENSVEFQEARRYLNGAERIYLLGFGYHTDNMRRLELPLHGHEYHSDARQIAGTCYGYSPMEITDLNVRYAGVSFADGETKILKFLRSMNRFVSDK